MPGITASTTGPVPLSIVSVPCRSKRPRLSLSSTAHCGLKLGIDPRRAYRRHQRAPRGRAQHDPCTARLAVARQRRALQLHAIDRDGKSGRERRARRHGFDRLRTEAGSERRRELHQAADAIDPRRLSGADEQADVEDRSARAERRLRLDEDRLHLVVGGKPRRRGLLRRPEAERLFRRQRAQRDLEPVAAAGERRRHHGLRRSAVGRDAERIDDDRMIMHRLHRQPELKLLGLRVEDLVHLVMRGENVIEQQHEGLARDRRMPGAGGGKVLAESSPSRDRGEG